VEGSNFDVTRGCSPLSVHFPRRPSSDGKPETAFFIFFSWSKVLVLTAPEYEAISVPAPQRPFPMFFFFVL